MSSNPQNLVVSPQTPTTAKMLKPDGSLDWAWFKFFQDLAQAVNNALTILGQFNGIIGTDATVEGQTGTLANRVQHLGATGDLNATHLTGVVQPAQLPAALPLAQGAVQLPAGAPSNVLGSAALQPSTAFDAAGSAAAAQAAAEAASDPVGSAATAQANAETYTDSKFAGAVSGTINLAKLTTGGANGSITVTNGLITGFVNPT